jgi:hypothetical protein
MCDMCKGATRDDVVAKLHLQIVERGFAIVPVGTAAGDKGWAYTIGLIESRDHPELVVAGYQLGCAVFVLNELGTAVLAGARLDATGYGLAFHGAEIGARWVHEKHLRDNLIAAWHWYYGSIGRHDLVPTALQICLPDGGFCFEHQTSQPRLDDPRHVPFDGMTRQQRRSRPALGCSTNARLDDAQSGHGQATVRANGRPGSSRHNDDAAG